MHASNYFLLGISVILKVVFPHSCQNFCAPFFLPDSEQSPAERLGEPDSGISRRSRYSFRVTSRDYSAVYGRHDVCHVCFVLSGVERSGPPGGGPAGYY